MLLTITTTYKPATDIGFLLHKNPDKLHTLPLSFGKAHVFYPEATEERCTAALLLDVDPVGLVRKGRGDRSFALEQYVNDRPYVASSFMSVALNRCFRTLMSGKCKNRQELVNAVLPLEVKISVLPCRGGIPVLESLFRPLGYEIEAQCHALDETFLGWGESQYYTVVLKRSCSLKEFLTHLYVLIPVLDNEKHYYISDEEIEKLLRFGAGWLEKHPEKEMITRRYLQFRSIANEALTRLADEDTKIADSAMANEDDSLTRQEALLEEKISLNEQRLKTVVGKLKAYNAKRVIDLGCGEGNLLKELLADSHFDYIVGCDVSSLALERAHTKLRIERLPSMQRKRITLMQTALTYRDKRLSGFDAAAIIEVIEHLDLPRLDSLRRVVFEFARPGMVVMTTPNVEYNVLFENLPEGKFRHSDHRFEWTRKDFEDWSKSVAEEFGYSVSFESIGEIHAEYGAPTQMGVFVRQE